MKLPNGDRAVVDIVKLHDYCLNMLHPRGRHKARVFASALGLTSANAEDLRDVLLLATQTAEAFRSEQDAYGQRYVVDFEMSRAAGKATIRSAWIIRTSEEIPRFTSCYIL